MPIKTQKENTFIFELKNFEAGFSPLAHLDSLTERGAEGSASVMTNAYILDGLLTQGSALSNLTNGTQAGVVSELINHILDKPTSDSVTYGIGATKLFKITPTTVTSGGDPSWPQAITDCTDGESVIQLGTNLYGFYNKSSGGDILKMPLSTEAIDPDWGSAEPTGKAALQKAIHPVAVKEDIMIFGNGQYVGTYIGDTDTLAPTKLDFGSGYEVADIIFHGNYWYIAVNGGITGTNNITGQIYLYDGAATESILADETAVGIQKIGFLYVLNGVIYVAYQDLSSTGGYNIGYILGRQIKRLASFTGGLPNFAQKTLYQSTILFVSGGSLWSCGAVSPDFPAQISQIADGGWVTVRALSSPFGTPMVASGGSATFTAATTDIITSNAHGLPAGDVIWVSNSGGALPTGLSASTDYYVIEPTTNTFKVSTTKGGTAVDITSAGTGTHTWYCYRLAQFSGYDITTTWKSVVIPCTFGKMKGYIDEISVLTRALGGSGADIAGATLIIEADQTTINSTSKSITTIGKMRHIFNGFGLGGVTDFRIALTLNGSTTYPCKIRRIQGKGHWVEA